jgi:hypothetical protein
VDIGLVVTTKDVDVVEEDTVDVEDVEDVDGEYTCTVADAVLSLVVLSVFDVSTVAMTRYVPGRVSSETGTVAATAAVFPACNVPTAVLTSGEEESDPTA